MIVLDTHALIWWVADPKRVPAKATRLITSAMQANEAIGVSSMSIWEITMLVANERLAFSMDVGTWIEKVEALPFLSFIPVDNRIATRSVQLDGFPHRDPADRIIVATTLGLGATLISADARLRAYRGIRTVWN